MNHDSSNLPAVSSDCYRILISDDQKEIRNLMKEILEMEGYICRACERGVETIKEFEKFKPHLLSTDIDKPDMDGIELIRLIKGCLDPQIPVIIISGSCNAKKLNQALVLGVDAYLAKPFHAAELIQRVRDVLEKRGIKGDKVGTAE